MPAHSTATRGVISSSRFEMPRIPGCEEPISRNQLLPRRVCARQNVLQGDEMYVPMQALSPSMATCGRRATSSFLVISPFRYDSNLGEIGMRDQRFALGNLS